MKFSILIPTKERCDLCINAIHSALNQNVDLEVIVSDASKGNELENVCKEINDDRLFYFRTLPTTIMTNNWLNAYKHSKGDFIIIIGDDDYLVKDVLFECEKVIDEFNCKAISLGYISYSELTKPGFLNFGNYDYKNRIKNIKFENVFKSFLWDGSIPHPSLLVLSRNLYDNIENDYKTTYDLPYPDFSFMSRLFTLNETLFMFNIPQVLVGRYPKSFTLSTLKDKDAFNDEIGSEFSFSKLNAPITMKGIIDIVLASESKAKEFGYKIGWHNFYFMYLMQLRDLKKNKINIRKYLFNLHKVLFDLGFKYELLVLYLFAKKALNSIFSALHKKQNNRLFFDNISQAADYVYNNEL